MEGLKERLSYAMNLRGVKAVDICTNCNIPKSAMSQYLSGHSKNMTADRLYDICKFLDVSEVWMMGYDSNIERGYLQRQADRIARITDKMRNDNELFDLLEDVSNISAEQRAVLKTLIDSWK